MIEESHKLLACKVCLKKWSARVSYCPYCGKPADGIELQMLKNDNVVVENKNSEIENTVISFSSEELNSATINKVPAPLQDAVSDIRIEFTPKDETVINGTGSFSDVTQKKNSNKNFIIGSIVTLVIFISIFFLYRFYFVVSVPSYSNSGAQNKDSSLLILKNIVDSGVTTSVIFSSIPAIEETLNAAKQLANNRPQYQENVISQERNLKETKTKYDNALLSYYKKLLDIKPYSIEQKNYALNNLKNTNLSKRESLVIELVEYHLSELQNRNNLTIQELQEGFNSKFASFTD